MIVSMLSNRLRSLPVRSWTFSPLSQNRPASAGGCLVSFKRAYHAMNSRERPSNRRTSSFEKSIYV